MTTILKTSELQLADVVCQMDSRTNPFSTCVVTKVEDGKVTLFRPYAVTADFSYTGGVIPYTGTEQYEVEQDSNLMWDVFSRKELK